MYTDKERTLYILGNGFDFCHGLNTGTDRFLEILEAQSVYNIRSDFRQRFL